MPDRLGDIATLELLRNLINAALDKLGVVRIANKNNPVRWTNRGLAADLACELMPSLTGKEFESLREPEIPSWHIDRSIDKAKLGIATSSLERLLLFLREGDANITHSGAASTKKPGEQDESDQS